jgi:hypothetical protein
MEETYRFVHEFKPELFGAKLEEATAERNKAQAMAADPEVLPLLEGDELKEARAEGGQLGGRPKTREMASEPDAIPVNQAAENLPHIVMKVIPDHGNHASYIVRRLKRDSLAIAADLAAGKYPSARAAGIAAGIVKVPTPLDLVKKLLPKLDEAGRAEVRGWLDGMEG